MPEALTEVKALLADFTGYVLACRRMNQAEYMRDLAAWITKVCRALGDTDTWRYNGDGFVRDNKEESQRSSLNV